MNRISITIFLALLATLSCHDKDDDTPPNCGCTSKTIDTVPSDYFPEAPIEEQTSGLLFYKKEENIDFFDDKHNGLYNDTFWIFKETEGCYNCRRIHIICNEELLGSEYEFLKSNNDSIPIIFRGNLKFLCVELFVAPADYFYLEIKLTSIEQQ